MKVKFSATVDVPDGTPESDIQQWLEFELGETAELSLDNAMSHADIMSAGCKDVFLECTL